MASWYPRQVSLVSSSYPFFPFSYLTQGSPFRIQKKAQFLVKSTTDTSIYFLPIVRKSASPPTVQKFRSSSIRGTLHVDNKENLPWTVLCGAPLRTKKTEGSIIVWDLKLVVCGPSAASACIVCAQHGDCWDWMWIPWVRQALPGLLQPPLQPVILSLWIWVCNSWCRTASL